MSYMKAIQKHPDGFDYFDYVDFFEELEEWKASLHPRKRKIVEDFVTKCEQKLAKT